ncbi:MAG: AsmA family protein [Prevotellaceae bacterium]|jgi:hypothetical protein|nr:AsmA family protein [Prevotellaceae bacterium]
MKKALKITGISIGSLILLIIVTLLLAPVFFKDKLAGMAKEIINKNLNAVVDFKNVDISLFSHFPKITVSIEDLSVVAKNDTLLHVASFDAGINLMSYISRGEIDLKLVEINSPTIHAKVYADSSANWDITKPSDAPAAVETSDESSGFRLSIEKFAIIDGAIMYEDLPAKMFAAIGKLNFNLKGDMSNSITTLDLNTSMESINLMLDNTMYLSNFDFAFTGKLNAELDKMKFTLADTEISLNRIALLADGFVQIEKNDDITVDINYAAKVASLKTLLALVPASILPETKNLDTKGAMSLSGSVKGVYGKQSMPVVAAELSVENGYLKYTQLPKSVDNINIKTKMLLDMNNDVNTNIDVSRFHFDIGGNPFDISTNIKTPMTDATIKAALKGKLDFASIKDALPLENIDLQGVLTAGVDFAGKMSHIEKNEYDRLSLDGKILLQNFVAVTEDLPLPLNITNAGLEFTPKYVNLSNLEAKIGESDLKVSGRLENFLNYAFKDDVLKGNLQMSSKYLNCNQLMSPSSGEPTQTTTDTGALSVIVLPSNVDFTVKADIGKILYDNLTLTNARGDILIKDHVLNINNLSAGYAGGQIQLAGKYKADNTTSALANMDMKLTDIHVKDIVNSFDMFSKALPLLKEVDGKMSMNFNFSDSFDKNMNPVLMALNAVGNIRADSLKILNQQSLSKITSLIGMKDKSNMLKNINANFAVSDGKININPFPASAGSTNFMLGGAYGIDNSLDMQVDVKIPAAQITGAVNDLLSKFGGSSNALSANSINLGIAIGGTLKNPTFAPTKAKYFNESPSVQQQATEQAKQLLEEKKQELQNQAEEKVKDEINKQKDDAVNKIRDLFKKR